MRITRTPLRISLIGGGTDVPAFYEKNTGAVVSFTIDKYVYVTVNKKFDGRVRMSYSKIENVPTVDELQHDLARSVLQMYKIKSGVEVVSVSDIPGTGTGLGSSSAFTVGLLQALDKNSKKAILAERAFHAEAVECGHPVGKQDQYACAHGGFNYFVFKKNKVEVEPIFPNTEWMNGFRKHCLLLWTGMTRDANDILERQRKSFANGGNTEIGIQMARLAVDFHSEFVHGMIPKRIGEFLQEAWKIKKFLANGISNGKIESWVETAMQNGAYGAKILGAGGGGFLFLIAPPEIHHEISQAVGLRKVDFNFDLEGSVVIYGNRN